MSFLENLTFNNQFPIIFIGSGITQRYFSEAPTWDKLLQKIWSETNASQSYFSRYDDLKNEHGEDTFTIYTMLADELEKIFDSQFYNGQIELRELTPEKAHNEEISPFKTRIAELFSNLKLNNSVNTELKSFKQC
ncbi:hypothetical protein [Rummeliibacillus suwonensis]|uniref:hypothetical protein n=1 Tax=Rummeliibacillus suwonensis TaxID=1306154 RepID=UPI002896A451|nr:hypothetical protein [Rummeliibacillus suwonensis]